MAGNSHKHTRLVNYGRKRSQRRFSFRLWFIIPIAALLAFVAALILGNTLGEIAVPGEGTQSTETQSKDSSYTPQGNKQIHGFFVSLRGVTYDTAGEVSRQIPDGALAVSMELFDSSGRPYYSSSVAEAFGKECGELTLKNAFKPIIEGGLYSSVLFPSSLLKTDDENKYAVISAYEATLAKELSIAGADEAVVYFSPLGSSGTELSTRSFELMTDYIKAMRGQAEGLRIGIVLSVTDLKAFAGSAELERLCAAADFCAADLTGFTDTQKLTDTLVPLASTVLRHEMRLIVSANGKNEEYLSYQSELFHKLGAKNIQYAEIGK